MRSGRRREEYKERREEREKVRWPNGSGEKEGDKNATWHLLIEPHVS